MQRSEAKKRIFFDPKFKAQALNILPGEFHVTNEDHMLVTILGSCVSACVRDPVLGIGGMNHFLLAGENGSDHMASARYGAYAMECLVNELIKMGGLKNRFEIKIFGGSNLLNSRIGIGAKNVDFIKRYLQQEGFKIAAEDLGGDQPRKIYYWPKTGKVIRQIINNATQNILDEEKRYKNTLPKEKIDGDVELFT